MYFLYSSAKAAFVLGPKFPAPSSESDVRIHRSTWNSNIIFLTLPSRTIYPSSANASIISADIPPCDCALVVGKFARFTRPLSIPSRSMVLRFVACSLLTNVPVTCLTHHARARLSPASPYPIHMSIRSCGCPRTHASTIAPHLSSTRPSPSPSKKICVPKSYDFGAAIMPANTGVPLAPCVPFPFSFLSASRLPRAYEFCHGRGE